jgi:hypothetical protein
MRCIPGSERISEHDEDRLTSLARFEALMREVDEQKIQNEEDKNQNGAVQEVSEWNLDESSSEYSDESEPEIENEDSDEIDGLEFSDDEEVGIPAQAQAIEYISGRRTPIPGKRPLSPAPNSPPVPYLNSQALSALHGSHARTESPTGLRPRTGTIPSPVNHAQDGRFRPFAPARSLSGPSDTSSREMYSISNQGVANADVERDDRQPRDSLRRLSFQEFTKRLSSTSSLLLVQSNVSSSANSSRESGSANFDSIEGTGQGNRSNGERNEGQKDKTCSWRGSVGVFGEGGF